MISLLLPLHIIIGLVLLVVSLRVLVKKSTTHRSHLYKNMIIILGILTILLGLGVGVTGTASSVVVCAKLAAYSVLPIVALFRLHISHSPNVIVSK